MAELTLKQSLAAMDIAEYLRQNPRFLENFPDVAAELVIPREHGPAASLAAYQLETLRARNRELNERLAELVSIAGDNEQLMVRVHTLTVGLLRDDDLADTCRSFVGALHEDFHTGLVRLVLFRDGADLPHADWLLCVPEGAQALPEFADFIARGEPACGRLAQQKLDRLFGTEAALVQSAALLKIGSEGMLAIGSDDANRFHPGIGTIFLKLIAQALDAAISRFPAGTK
ncbi:MAG: DUF484 family protein [Xanthomonadales bacterium]|nr:DUF484 family protein [Xanthomonadales bacterium]ODU92119.1 MAG: hypothetical protein ABT18_13670 [Rhodanobacter sp. SCN 66-43]OJY86017.1 MAG: hypothetical protein BGP23_05020 [Xanthomonadales bacterium 66-474]